MDVTKEINRLIENELKEANENKPYHHSLHEAYGVLKEEIEELIEEVSYCQSKLEEAWDCTRIDEVSAFYKKMNSIKVGAIFAIKEAIQVAAMAQKAIDSEVKA